MNERDGTLEERASDALPIHSCAAITSLLLSRIEPGKGRSLNIGEPVGMEAVRFRHGEAALEETSPEFSDRRCRVWAEGEKPPSGSCQTEPKRLTCPGDMV